MTKKRKKKPYPWEWDRNSDVACERTSCGYLDCSAFEGCVNDVYDEEVERMLRENFDEDDLMKKQGIRKVSERTFDFIEEDQKSNTFSAFRL